MTDQVTATPTPVPTSSPTPGETPPASGMPAPSGRSAARSIRSAANSLLVPVLAVFTALVVGGIVIILSDAKLIAAWGAVATDPGAAIGGSWNSVMAAYGALFRGSIGDPAQFATAFASGDTRKITLAFSPISETLLASTPLIFTGLAVALGFRSGLFNIGAEGQLYLGAICATWVGINFGDLPLFVHLPLALLGGFLGGAVWAGIPGLLKARTGAHEVITTIMLNYTSYLLLDLVLNWDVFQRPGRTDPISRLITSSSQLPLLVPPLRVHWGFILAIAAAVVVSWLLFRSTKGFEFRAVGLNPFAARYAGIGIGRTLVLTMAISGGLAGIGGASEILGVTKTLTNGFSPGYGFDAIALALLGRSRPAGVVAAALLFGALRAGATPMQAATGIPIHLVVVIQALVIMFVAAPALVRGLYRIRTERITGTEVFTQGWGA